MPDALHGWISDFNEQGMEADYWLVFQDEAFVRDGQWDRAGMILLAPGHHLTIYEPEGAVRWSGPIGTRRTGFFLSLLGRERPHWHPPDVPFETWVGWFRERPSLRATLVRDTS